MEVRLDVERRNWVVHPIVIDTIGMASSVPNGKWVFA
jgi:hypothetical protein